MTYFMQNADCPFVGCRSVEAERDQLRDDKFVLEQTGNELQETLDTLQDEAETNKAVLMSRIQFLSNELRELDSDSREAVRLQNPEWCHVPCILRASQHDNTYCV